MSRHVPVLIDEAIQWLVTEESGCYVDGTFGRGGHSRAILTKLDPKGRLFAFDKDKEAVVAGEKLAQEDERFTLLWRSYAELADWAEATSHSGKVSGVLLDLGVSSAQLDDSARGFSFMRDGPLDMRMNTQAGVSVAQWLANVDEATLAQVLRDYGEERHAYRIAKAVMARQSEAPFVSTVDLAEVVARAHPAWPKDKHPATKTFQALRLVVNDELEELRKVLEAIPEVLSPKGRLVAISFHSLEDRLVKRLMQEGRTLGLLRPLTRPIYPSATEMTQNPRARSAVMRVLERCDEGSE